MPQRERSLSWEGILGRVKAFSTRNGRHPSTTAENEREVALARWLRDQQGALRSGLLSPYRESLLRGSGLPLTVRPDRLHGRAQAEEGPDAALDPAPRVAVHASLQPLLARQRRLSARGHALAACRQAQRTAPPVAPPAAPSSPAALAAHLAEYDACFVDRSQLGAVMEMARRYQDAILLVTEEAIAAAPAGLRHCQPAGLGAALEPGREGAVPPLHVVLVDLHQRGMSKALVALSQLGACSRAPLPSLAVLGGPAHRNLCRLLGLPERQARPEAAARRRVPAAGLVLTG